MMKWRRFQHFKETDLESLSLLRVDALLGPAVLEAIKKLSDPS
jgi:hypothetical protein